VCKTEHGITWAEFQELTLAEFEALENRREIRIRHARFNAALTTSVIFNANRPADSRPVSPFDFLAGFEDNEGEKEREEKRRSIKRSVALAFIEMRNLDGSRLNSDQVQDEKRKMIERMKENGVEDPEEIIREVYPDL
jgi:hypothetical protein